MQRNVGEKGPERVKDLRMGQEHARMQSAESISAASIPLSYPWPRRTSVILETVRRKGAA